MKKGEKMETPNDLVQIDIETALALYVKGYTHIPVLKRDSYSSDWTSFQPLYLDDILEGLMCFASDSKRAELLNPPKVDIAKVKESIYLDDDPDWVEPDEEVETEPEPDNFEELDEDDEVPKHDRIPYEKPEVLTVAQVTEIADSKTDKQKAEKLILAIQMGTKDPLKWNAREAVKLNDNGMNQRDLAELYGISFKTVNKRLKEYRSKS